jgi:cbb3-type cytochrome oxidase maturation protein
MSVLYLLIPLSLLLAGLFVALCLIAIKSGQFRDLESPRWRILFDETHREGGR